MASDFWKWFYFELVGLAIPFAFTFYSLARAPLSPATLGHHRLCCCLCCYLCCCAAAVLLLWWCSWWWWWWCCRVCVRAQLCLAQNKRVCCRMCACDSLLWRVKQTGIIPGTEHALVTCDTWYEVPVVSKSQIIPVPRRWKSCYFWAWKSPDPLILASITSWPRPRNNDHSGLIVDGFYLWRRRSL